MKRNKHKHYCNNCGNSKVGDASRNCNNSTTTDFAKNKSTITDNEYEVTSENNNKKKRSK
jgi:hypothetical protein